MVVLEKPVGLTLAPDPRTGQVVVQDIKPNSPAHKCGLIQVGDVVKSCSAVFGDDMWAAGDIRRVRWAINSRCGDVRLILERARRPAGAGHEGVTAWYCGGKAGVASREREGTQLPLSLNGSSGGDETCCPLDLPGPGRVVQVAFHRNPVTPPPPTRRAAAAAAARVASLQRLRAELAEARALPRLDLAAGAGLHARPGGPDGFVLPAPAPALDPGPGPGSPYTGMASKSPSGVADAAAGARPSAPASAAQAGTPPGPGEAVAASFGGAPEGPPPPPPVVEVVAPPPPPSSAGGGVNGGGLMSMLKLGGNGTAAAAAAASGATQPSGCPSDRKVVSFLPWLLVSCGRLEHRHLAAIASARSLGALLELNLTRTQQRQQQQAAGGAATPSADRLPAEPASPPSPCSPSSSASSPGPGPGGYMVVRGSDLVPHAADIGRVSYAALSAAAMAGSGSKPGSAALPPPQPACGEPPPPPGSAAATAAMLDAPAPPLSTSASACTPPGPHAASGGGPRPSGPGANGGSSSGGAATATAGDAGRGANSGGGGSGLGGSTLAFLNRSIFVNLRPNLTPPGWPTAAALPPTAASGAGPSPSSAPSSAPCPSARYDPVRVRHLLSAAASVQRLAFRRLGRLGRGGWRRDGVAVLLHCDEGMEGDVAVLLAGWLHWFRRLPLQEAILAAETALGAAVDQALLEAGTSALLSGGRERCSRVVLTWKYGGLSAHVAGDVVASWGARVAMVRCRSPLGCKGDTHPGHFYLEVVGLRPGVYTYKYIVDGTWAVDPLAPKVLDAAGNWNNVLLVPELPQVLTSREGLALARWQAARLALEAKMGLQGPGAVQRPV